MVLVAVLLFLLGGIGAVEPHRQTYVLGDLHGDYLNTVLMLHASHIVLGGRWAAGNSTLVQLGDIVDRGPDGKKIYDLFDRLRPQAREAGGDILHLFGNHEALNMCGVLRYLHPDEITTHYKDSEGELRSQWGIGGVIGDMIRKEFNIYQVHQGVVYVHAGLLPSHAKKTNAELKERFLHQIDVENCPFGLSSKLMDVLGDTGPMWTRYLAWTAEYEACPILQEVLDVLGVDRMVVGHSPTESGNVEWRCDKKLLMADTGNSRYVRNSPRVVKIGRNDWTEIAFEVESIENGRIKYKYVNERIILDLTGKGREQEPEVTREIPTTPAPMPLPHLTPVALTTAPPHDEL